MRTKAGSAGGRQAAQRERSAKAIRMRAEGATYADIAVDLGYAGPSGAYKAVMKGLPKLEQEAAEELRQLQCARLDDLLAEVWPTATDEHHPRHLSAVSRALAIMHRMDVLAGLDR